MARRSNFEWYPEKAEANHSKHGVSLEEAVAAFGDPLSMNMPDTDHSKSEQRFIVLGMSDRYRLPVVSYTDRH
ncbi:MAG TPA: BrnT family toxin, partial [Candidatus Limnocylindria bacterium]|nr:BrnT family toxin [Candidatus Limnocylindria bacterium]